MSKEYCWSTTGEDFKGKYASPEDAFKAAAEMYPNAKPGDRIYVGEIVEPDIRSLVEGAATLCDLFERISENAYEFGGEASEDWPTKIGWIKDVMMPEEVELQNKIVDLIVKYFEEHDLPCFWGVKDIVVLGPSGKTFHRGRGSCQRMTRASCIL